jgi:hypothetical protein
MAGTRPIPLLLFIAFAAVSCGDADGHTHAGFEIPEGEAVPTVELVATEDPVSGWNLQLTTTNFDFAPQRAGREVVLGEGHAHLYIDGENRDRVYGPWYHLEDLTPGRHTIEVTLNSNDHAVYQVDGKTIGARTTVEAVEENHAHSGAAVLEAGSDMSVVLRVEDDPLSGWNLFVDTTGFTWAPERAGREPVSGEGHAHLFVDGQKIGRIYGPVTYLASLDPGQHTVTVSLNGNNHAAYQIGGEPVAATTTLEVTGEPNQPDHIVAIDVRLGEVMGGVKRLVVSQGDLIEITVRNDAPDSTHVHVYDLYAAVGPDREGVVAFTATIRGVFEIELEQSGLLVAKLTVR